MSVNLPVYKHVGINGFQMYPGTSDRPGIHHDLTPGLHLIAGVNGLGKSTLLLVLYHGIVGPSAVRNDDFGVPMPEVALRRDAEKFRRRVADGAKNATAEVEFQLGVENFVVERSLHDLGLIRWSLNGAEQDISEDTYMRAVTAAMRVGSFADVIIILNLIIFMFESRGLLMWSPYAQRNALRALFMLPEDANDLARRAQAVATANSAYRNLLYIVNRDRKQLAKDRAALAGADALAVEHGALLKAIAAQTETLTELYRKRTEIEQARSEARTAVETAKFQYDEALREIEGLKLARVASAFPDAEVSSRYVLARLVGDKECLACGAEGGPLIDRWTVAVADGACLICGSHHEAQEAIVPPTAVDTARLDKAEGRLRSARDALDAATAEAREKAANFEQVQQEIDITARKKFEHDKRVQQLALTLPPSPPQVAALEDKVTRQSETLNELREQQVYAEQEFSTVFERFSRSIESKADLIRTSFAEKISDFLVERAEISLAFVRGPIGESGQSYDWPTFQLSMTSGTFEAPAPRRHRGEVSMSQGEFIDLAFRLALVEAAASDGPASMIFDAPEASLDALFMRRAGAFLGKFTRDHVENRLIVTSNLTNADMIPALFGAYTPETGDPQPIPIPRPERRQRVVDLLTLAAPTSAVELVGERYRDLLEKALFPPNGAMEPGL